VTGKQMVERSICDSCERESLGECIVCGNDACHAHGSQWSARVYMELRRPRVPSLVICDTCMKQISAKEFSDAKP
jgi:hypothetical protein